LETGTLSVRNGFFADTSALTGGLTVGLSLSVTGSGSFVSATTTYNTTANIFSIATASSTSPIFSVLGNGNVGIGSTTPNAKLSIEQGTETYSMYVGKTASSSPSFAVGGVNDNGRVYINATTTTATSSIALVVGNSTRTTGNVASFTSGTGVCYINPTATALSSSSDARLKKNIRYDRRFHHTHRTLGTRPCHLQLEC
jgi:hypothetical protein